MRDGKAQIWPDLRPAAAASDAGKRKKKRAHEDSVPVIETEFWQEMERNRVSNLLAGTRLKAGLTQGQLARKLGIQQNMVSDYERGRRRLSASMAKRFSVVLKLNERHLE